MNLSSFSLIPPLHNIEGLFSATLVGNEAFSVKVVLDADDLASR